MKIYFVRHGSTDALENKLSQTNDEPLNENGLAQAKEVGKRFENVVLDIVVSSSHMRAKQTAGMIRDKFEVCELFGEVRKPKEVIGQPKSSEEVKAILKKIGEMYLVDPSWHFSDEENFEDLKARGLKALEYLKSLNKENVAVVSHANFIALMAGLMMMGEEYPVGLSLKLKNFFRLSATGVCIFTFDGNKWKMQCWNDTSHCPEESIKD